MEDFIDTDAGNEEDVGEADAAHQSKADAFMIAGYKAAAVEKFAEVSVGDDMTKWTVLLKGPDGVDPELPFAPFAGATFTVEIQFPSEYPFKAPKVRFDTPIFHPNGESALRSLSASSCLNTMRV